MDATDVNDSLTELAARHPFIELVARRQLASVATARLPKQPG